MRILLSFVILLFVSSVHAAPTVCSVVPSTLMSDLVKGNASAQNTLWQMVKECPTQVQKLGNSSLERLVVKGNLSTWQKNLEDVIQRDYQDRDLSDQESDFESLAQFLGKGPRDAKMRNLLKQSKNSAAREKQCTAIDNRNDSLGPVRNQGEVGWCYAFTAADLISYKLKTRVSAVDIAYGFNQKDLSIIGEKLKKALDAGEQLTKKNRFALETSSEGGTTTEAINYQAVKGVCLEKDLPSDDTTMSNLKTSLDELDRLKYQMEKDPTMCEFGAYKASFARFPVLSIRQILQTAYDTDYSQVMVKLADKNCEGKRISMKGIKAVEIVVNNEKTSRDAFAMLDEALQNKSIAGIGYDMKILSDDGNSGSHASSIVGRRYNIETNECEYLLRNSWGDKFDDSSSVPNAKGYYWVPKTSLKSVLTDVTVIK